MQILKSFFKRITDDLKQKKLIPLKILFFVHASTLFVLYPYLTIHMRELGVSVEETAVMSAVTPVVSIVMPPLAGMLADKIGNFRVLLGVSSALGGVAALLLLAVPAGRVTRTLPPRADLLAECSRGALSLRPAAYPCKPLHPYAYDINLTLSSCGFICDVPTGISRDQTEEMLRARSYDIDIHSEGSSRRLLYHHTFSPHVARKKPTKMDPTASRLLANNPYFNVSIARLADSEIFFPAPNLYKADCIVGENSTSCDFGSKKHIYETVRTSEVAWRARVVPRVESNGYADGFEVKSLSNDRSSFDEYDESGDVMCTDNYKSSELAGGGVQVQGVGGGAVLRFTACRAACAAAVPRALLCDNSHQKIEIDPVFTFWTYLAVRVFIGIIGGTAFAMFEGAVISIVREQRADYGLQRLYGSLGGVISSPLSGALIDYASKGKGYTDFRPAFYLYAILKVASGVLMLSIDLQFKQPAQNLLKDVITVFANVEIVALFLACFVMGTAWGYIESFLFWLLQDLGASRSLMGITVTVGGAAGLPLLVLSGPILRRLGHANVIFIGFVFYAIRLLGYSLIYEPWLCLIFEALESVTSSLAFTAAVTYAARLSSTTTDTSVQGLLGGIYFGVGKGSGSLIGGYLMKYVGTRQTYRIFSAATLVTGCIYFLFNTFIIRKMPNRSRGDDSLKKHAALDIECKESKVEKVCDKINSTIDAAKQGQFDVNKVIDPLKDTTSKLISENADGGSDSGIDNPAFTETDTPQDAKNNVIKK